MMHPLYLLESPIEKPVPPQHWSYSTLKAFRQCPKRWWLERCRYPNVVGSFYPAQVAPAALEGQLVHRVVEEWEKAVRRGEEPGSVRLMLKLALREALTALKGNPRVDSGRLAAAVSLDACVAKAQEMIRDVEPVAAAAGNTRVHEGSWAGGAPSSADEFWLIVDDPPLKGQLDRVRHGVVTDLKTGAPDPSHTEQLYFYALLWWLKYGELPERLELRYPGTSVPVPLPTDTELRELAETIRAEVSRANAELESGTPRAKPSVEGCRYCPVRQLCNEFWDCTETGELRFLMPGPAPTGLGKAQYGDIELVQLPAERRPDGAVGGEAVATGLGSLRVRIGAHLVPPVSELVTRARILGARLADEGGGQVISTTNVTEVFWQR